MSKTQSMVFVVDDDRSVRESLVDLISSVGMKVEAFSSAQEFLRHKRADTPACLVLDVRLPGPSGLDLQRQLVRSENPIPIIFITGHGDIPMSVRALKDGAVEFLTKPFRDQDLLDAIHEALDSIHTCGAVRLLLPAVHGLLDPSRELDGWHRANPDP